MTSLGASRNRFLPQLAGLYLILDQHWESRCLLLDVMCEAGEIGVNLVQYRNKFGVDAASL